jgi:hypothetical protein
MSDMRQVLDFLNSIEGAGYGGMAAYEIARSTVKDSASPAPETPAIDGDRAADNANIDYKMKAKKAHKTAGSMRRSMDRKNQQLVEYADEISRLKAQLSALASLKPSHGDMVLVPREPTRTMTMAACDLLPADPFFGVAGRVCADIYKAMISAVPPAADAPAMPAPGITREAVEALRIKIEPEIDKMDGPNIRVMKFNSFHTGKNAALDAVIALMAETVAVNGGSQ